jgi:hypothetical protein
MSKRMSPLTARLSLEIVNRHGLKFRAYKMDWEDVRDLCDSLSGGELDCTQLDMLTDWVIDHSSVANPRIEEVV